MEEFKIEGRDQIFRIKSMNAIEIFSLRAVMDFETMKGAMNTTAMLLERLEVQCGDKWLPVKDGNNYYPAGIENDYASIEQLILKINTYLKSVFQKSRESKK